MNYIATWFYRESADEASFYPQMGQRGDSALVHSVYMQIQVPFFRTFRHYNPAARLLFFTNLRRDALPRFLLGLFDELGVETVTLPYERRPPKGWYGAWQNQFYLYDILGWMGGRMKADDALLVCDADCLCRTPLDGLFDEIRKQGSALYEFITDRSATINGITLPEMEAFYTDCYGTPPRSPLAYYGGEFIGLRGDSVCRINEVYAGLWAFNLARADRREPKLNEEAHVLSVLAERLDLRNAVANRYVKRMWTSPQFNNVCPEDERLAVWHLPYEKKRGLYRLFRLLEKQKGLGDEERFWHRAKELTGVPAVSLRKRLRDRWTTLLMWFTRI
ncbi:hypothetical protein [Phocaeicola salanitronis]|uniref:hypothetical protein n=1 Tax=Phocaeicola salanitronis TaxID=376805 RepID=UPI0025A3AB39|nr:hypothetical protein [Phocaeicola salanitronis]MDM8306915.1 hypothetical protein [Phocaeicola salanitronis]